MSDLIINTAFNLFVGDAGPDNEKRLNIKNLKVPDMEEMTQQHHSGGSWGAIEVGGLGMKELSSQFKLTGHDPQTMSQFGIGGRVRFPFTAYGNAVSKSTGQSVGVIYKMFGRLVGIKRQEQKRGELLEYDHEIKEILRYQEFYGEQEKFYWDWKTGVFRVDGVVVNQDELDNLGVVTTQ